jgi:hypothetical protein
MRTLKQLLAVTWKRSQSKQRHGHLDLQDMGAPFIERAWCWHGAGLGDAWKPSGTQCQPGKLLGISVVVVPLWWSLGRESGCKQGARRTPKISTHLQQSRSEHLFHSWASWTAGEIMWAFFGSTDKIGNQHSLLHENLVLLLIPSYFILMRSLFQEDK